MLLRRLLQGVSASRLRRHSPRPPRTCPKTTTGMGPTRGPSVTFAEPPRLSHLHVPEDLPVPDHEADVLRFPRFHACAASQDGLLLLRCDDIRFRLRPDDGKPAGRPDRTYLVLNPLTGEISPNLLEIKGPRRRESLSKNNLGILTQADGRRSRSGPPDRYAVAGMELEEHMRMLRFLSETGEWHTVQGSTCQLPAARRMSPTQGQEVLAWGGRLWWVDLTWGAISADPFSDRLNPWFVELPSGSVLPEDAFEKAVSEEEPFVLSSFAIDADGSGWTLEHRVALSRLWGDGGHPWLPLQGKWTPQIGAIHPFQGNVVHLVVGNHLVIVDMEKGEVTGHCHCPQRDINLILPCVVPPWILTTQISSLGKKDVTKKNTLAHVLVRSDRRQKK
ncbi:hypothetical protein BRADI_4g13431v3 [Brachypodium distachyon]|uniref:DUF1618 domain-containing protein n=1 Tax=Brachypodium distachyon TaxID=15368 RepID=A0A0Q3INB9_BRADI|nr:hypothetical protein BRADI_4g13431v3 [Brachypodium distachyon]